MIIKRKNIVWVGLGCLVILGACIYVKGSVVSKESSGK